MRKRNYTPDYSSSRDHRDSLNPLEQIARTALELQKLIGHDLLNIALPRDSSRSDSSGYHNDSSGSNGDRFYSLCISKLPHRLSDHDVRNIIYREFETFDADFNVKFSTYNGQRVAYINFRSSRDASDARAYLRNFRMDDKLVHIEPIIQKQRSKAAPRRSREREKERSQSYHKNYSRNYNDSYVSHKSSSSNYRSDNYRNTSRSDHVDRYDRNRSRSRSRNYSQNNSRSSRSRQYNSSSTTNNNNKSSNYDSRDSNRDPCLEPTRTLFIGNLPLDVTENELRRLFDKFGPLTDIDIKKPPGSSRQSNSYAFVKFENLEVSSEAKLELNGKMLRNYQMKIGFGKVNPTSCIWVGGLGPWIQYDSFEKEMGRFGNVKKINWPLNKAYAYVLYDSVDVAINAVNHLRGAYLGDEKKAVIKIDYADTSFGDPETFEQKIRSLVGVTNNHSSNSSNNNHNSQLTDDDDDDDSDEVISAESAKSISQLIDCLSDIWTGMIVLKNNNFGCRLHMLKGDRLLIKDFLCSYSRQQDSTGPVTPKVEKLTITQRMKLDTQKLTEIRQRIEVAGENGFCFLLASAYVIDQKLITDPTNQPQRPLKNLITYLRTKESAGVIFLKQSNTSNQQQSSDSTSDKPSNSSSSLTNGVLHAFPPCDFSFELLLQKSPKLTKDYLRDDFLLVLLIRSSN